MRESKMSFWLSPRGLAALGLIAATGYFLFTEHWAHTVAVLPWAILLLCPLFHLFMHRGHGGHDGSGGHGGHGDRDDANDHDIAHSGHAKRER